MLEFSSLYSSDIIDVSDYGCTAGRGGPGVEEEAGGNKIVLVRRGVFCRHFGRRLVTSDATQVTFFSEDLPYRVSHPTDCGDRGTVLTVSSATLNDVIRELDASIDDHPDRPFPFDTGPCDTTTFIRHRELLAVLESVEGRPPDPLSVDELAMRLVAQVLRAAFQYDGAPKKQRRPRTTMNHADLAESAKSFVASRIAEHLSLDRIARAVETSPFHLARVFREHTGQPVHRYVTCLRLRTSLERLAAGADDLTALALELGFSSHSHFSDRFRREFGCPPSEMRRTLTRGRLGEVSKNVEVDFLDRR